MKIKRVFSSLDFIISTLLVAMILVDIILQVVSRLTPGNAISWTVEVGQMLLAAVIWMSIGPGVTHNAHVRFDLVLSKASSKIRRYLIAFGNILFAVFMIIMSVLTMQLLQFYANNNSVTTVLGWSKAIVRLPMLIGCIVGAGKLIYYSSMILQGKLSLDSDEAVAIKGGAEQCLR